MDDTLQPGLGHQLRAARRRLGLTQEQVARAVELAPEVYGRLERGEGKPSIIKLRALCAALGLSADSLLALRPPAAISAKAAYEGPSDLQRLMADLHGWPPERLRVLRRLVRMYNIDNDNTGP